MPRIPGNGAVRGWQGNENDSGSQECERRQWETGLNNLLETSVSTGIGLRRLARNVSVTVFRGQFSHI